MPNTQPTQINQKRFVRLFKDTLVEDSTMRFCFVLGPGASRSSGIQTKKDLTLKWFNEIEEDLGQIQFNRWIEDDGIDRNNLSLYYSNIIKKRFQFEPEMGYKILEQQVSQATPGVGYLTLAQILEKTSHNLAITSNADYLIEDALFSTASKAPMLFDNIASSEVQIQQTQRPMVFKLQQAMGSEEQVDISGTHLNHLNHLSPHHESILDQAFQIFRPILIGYSSNNKSLLEYLSQHDNTPRQPIFWCTRDIKNFSKKIIELLTKDDFIVEIEDFDELMFQIISSFDSVGSVNYKKSISFSYFKKDALQIIAKQKALEYENLFSKFQTPETRAKDKTEKKRIKTKKKKGKVRQKSPVIDDMDQLNDFMSSLNQHDHRKDDQQFREALKKEPFNATHNIKYAIFLEDCCSNPEKAADYFKTAMQLDPKNEKIKALYAFLLSHYFQDYDEAEIYYSSAFDIDPESVPINIMFGIFLHTVRKKFMAAEANFQAAFKATANDADYSDFMKEIWMDFDATEINYKKALEEDFSSAVS